MSKTTIAWTDDSLNPARGCTAVSPGCANCYAARHATRFSKPGLSFAGLARLKDQPRDANGRKRPKLAVWSGEVTLIPKALHEPLQLGALAVDIEHGICGARIKPLFVGRRLKDAHGGDESEWAPDLQGLRAFPIPAPLSPAQRRHLGIT